jgi:hypothetical protein
MARTKDGHAKGQSGLPALLCLSLAGFVAWLQQRELCAFAQLSQDVKQACAPMLTGHHEVRAALQRAWSTVRDSTQVREGVLLRCLASAVDLLDDVHGRVPCANPELMAQALLCIGIKYNAVAQDQTKAVCALLNGCDQHRRRYIHCLECRLMSICRALR